MALLSSASQLSPRNQECPVMSRAPFLRFPSLQVHYVMCKIVSLRMLLEWVLRLRSQEPANDVALSHYSHFIKLNQRIRNLVKNLSDIKEI